jgi:hypothetical protein
MTSLNLADNNIGQLVMSGGWQFDEDADEYWKEVEGEELVEKQLPAGEQLAIESPVGAIAIANAIKDMRVLTSLNLASNNLGELVLPDGWSIKNKGWSYQKYVHADGREQKDHPGKPKDVIALANAIPDMRAMTSLSLASNSLGVEGFKIIAAILPKCT